MNLPSFSTILYWLMPVPQYELRAPENQGQPGESQAGESPCTSDAPAPAPEPQLVFTGYRWVPRSLFVSSPNPAWEQEVEARVEEDGRKGLDRARDARPGEDLPPPVVRNDKGEPKP